MSREIAGWNLSIKWNGKCDAVFLNHFISLDFVLALSFLPDLLNGSQVILIFHHPLILPEAAHWAPVLLIIPLLVSTESLFAFRLLSGT